jgi:zinc protease
VLATLQRQSCADLSPDEERDRLWHEVLASGQRRLEQQRTSRTASGQATSALVRALVAGSNYETPPPAALAAITAEELAAWHASSRRPENAVLLVTGSLDLAQAERLVRGWFGSWHPRPVTRPPRVLSPAREAPAGRLYRAREATTAQAQLQLGCRIPTPSLPETSAGRVLARLLARDLRLRLRDQLGATYGVSADLRELASGVTVLRLSSDLAREHLGGALGESVARLEAIMATPPAAAVGQAQLEVLQWLGGPTSSRQLVDQALRLLMRGQPLELLDQEPAAIGRVTPAAVAGAAAACRRSLSLAVVGDGAAVDAAALPSWVVEELR